MNAALASITEQTLPILARYGVTKAGIFGSFARSEPSAWSDLDLVVDLPENSSLLAPRPRRRGPVQPARISTSSSNRSPRRSLSTSRSKLVCRLSQQRADVPK